MRQTFTRQSDFSWLQNEAFSFPCSFRPTGGTTGIKQFGKLVSRNNQLDSKQFTWIYIFLNIINPREAVFNFNFCLILTKWQQIFVRGIRSVTLKLDETACIIPRKRKTDSATKKKKKKKEEEEQRNKMKLKTLTNQLCMDFSIIYLAMTIEM